MLRTTLRSHLRNVVADADSSVVSDAELDDIIDLAVLEYARLRPLSVETTVTTTTDTLTYDLDDNIIEIISILNTTDVVTPFTKMNRTIRFTTDPGDADYTLLGVSTYTETSGDFDIPSFDLKTIVDVGTYILLERLADDIVRRPDIRDGQTSESWRNAAETLYARARELRTMLVTAIASSDFAFVG